MLPMSIRKSMPKNSRMLGARIAICNALGIAMLVSYAANAQTLPPKTQPQTRSLWINPYNDVVVETGECEGKLCGWVVWATPEAEQEAREGGTLKLVGTELLLDFRKTGPTTWAGHVFVPDMGRTFYSTIRLTKPGILKISGCILGGLICKSQIWRRA